MTYPKWCLSLVAVIVLCVTAACGSISSTTVGTSLAMVGNSSTSSSFTQFIQSVTDAHYSDYVHLSATKVENEQAFEEMRLYILKMYAGAHVVNTYVEGGQPIDCTVTSTQSSHPSPPEIVGSEGSHVKYASSTLLSSCGKGTIPVMRITLNTLVRFPTLRDFLSKDGNGSSSFPSVAFHAGKN